MANEKLMILKMLEDGKITAAEAARLLDASGDPAPKTEPYTERSNGPTRPSPSDGRSSYHTPPPPRSGDFAGELSRKFDAFARDLEPRLHRFSEVVVEKTADLAERISKSIDESRRPAPPYRHSAPPPPPYAGTEKRFELSVAPGYNELNLSGINGDVLIRGYNGDKISAKVSYKTRRSDAPLEFMRLGAKYFLNYDENDFERISIDAYVPSSMFSIIHVGNINGGVDLSSLEAADTLAVYNSNGATKLKGLTAGMLQVECSNGRLDLSQIISENAQIENFNGLIDGFDLNCANLKLINVNGGITMNVSSFSQFSEYVWDVETSNGKMTLNLPSQPDLGYHIKAHASLGHVKIGLVGLNYMVNSASMTEAKSIQYDTCPKKVKLILETSNGPLQVN